LCRQFVSNPALRVCVWDERALAKRATDFDAIRLGGPPTTGANCWPSIGPTNCSARGSRCFAAGPGASSLFEGPGRLLIDEIAESLSAVIELET
jgi:hypothetical protein